MKCPECGFDCLPDDIECLACGVDIAAAKLNQEKELVRSKEAIERQKQYEIELKKELGLIPDDDAPKASKSSKILEETIKKGLKCPKCDFDRVAGASDCPRCGIIYDKFKSQEVTRPSTARDLIPENETMAPPQQASPSAVVPDVSGKPPSVHGADSSVAKSEEITERKTETDTGDQSPHPIIEDIDVDSLRLETDDERVSLKEIDSIEDVLEGNDEKTDEIDISELKRRSKETAEDSEVSVDKASLKEDKGGVTEEADGDLDKPSPETAGSDEKTGEPDNKENLVSATDEGIQSVTDSDDKESVETEEVKEEDPTDKLAEGAPDLQLSDDKPRTDEALTEIEEASDDIQETAGADTEPSQQNNKPEAVDSKEIRPDLTEGEADAGVESNTDIELTTPIPEVEPKVIEVGDLLDDDDEKTEIVSLEKLGFEPRVKKQPEPKAKPTKQSGMPNKMVIAFTETVRRIVGAITGSRKQTKIIIGSVVATIILLLILVPVGTNYFKTAAIEKKKQEQVERLEKIRTYFLTNSEEITRDIKILINNKQFTEAQKEIDAYDIELLHSELIPLKNYLTEIKLYETVKLIPASEYEKNYNMFIELLSLNPESKLYSTKRDYYRKKYAESEYKKALRFFKKKKKNANDLTASLESIETAISLEAGPGKYKKLKKRLLTEKLLFYEGNSNLVLAVKDDGMGKRLYSGQRKLTIWLKNVGPEEIYINVKYFAMVGKNKKRYTYNDIGRPFKGKLLPGEQTRGELYFRTKTRPSRIVFSHLTHGEISREFP